MSIAPKKAPVAEGSVYLVPVAESVFGACRVVRQERLGWVVVLIDGFWEQPPSLDEILARPALIRGDGEARTVGGVPPKSFLCAGHAPLRLAETQVIVPPTPFLNWETLAAVLSEEHRLRSKPARATRRKSAQRGGA